MTLRSEIAEMEARREQLLDAMEADVHRLTHQIRENISPTAIIQRHPILTVVATILAGIVFGRAGISGKHGTANPASQNASPSQEPVGPLHRIIDFAERSGAVGIISAVPWRNLTGMLKSLRSKVRQDPQPLPLDGSSEPKESDSSA